MEKSFAFRFLRWICPPSLYEGIEGDLLEQYEADVEELGKHKAMRRLRWNVIRFYRPGIILRNSFSNHLTNTGMLQNYLTVALRNMLRNPGYTSLNVLGLALGLASCFLIGLYVRYELSFEDFHENKEAIYRYIPRYTKDGQMTMQVQTAPGIAPHLLHNIPEIEAVVRYTVWDNLPQLEWQDRLLPQGAVALADSSFFSVFSFELLAGNRSTVLNRPLSILLSKSMADAAFGDENPIGKTIRYNRDLLFEVTGVFADVPANSHLQFSYLVSLTSLPRLYGEEQRVLTSMYNWMFSTYLYAPRVADHELFQAQILESMTAKMKEVGFGETAGNHWLQPLTEIHFTQGIRGDGPAADIRHVYIFSAIAGFIILIACFNFMNLSTARAASRSKEVGIRKSMGAYKTQLITQFLGEAFLTVLLAAGLSVVLFWLVVPWFNQAMDLHLRFDPASDLGFLLVIVLLVAGTALVAGSYPAFYLSSFMPVRVLRGKEKGNGTSRLRNALTIFQFAIACFLLAGTFTVVQQTLFMKQASLGYDKEQVVHFYIPPHLRGQQFDILKQSLLSHPEFKTVAKCSDVPGDVTGHFLYEFTGGEEIRREAFTTIAADYDFFEALGIELIAGRTFSPDFASDEKQAYVVNETLVRYLRLDTLPEGPIGASFRLQNTDYPEGRIIGVVRDFHARSLQNKIEPMVLWLSNSGWEQTALVKLSGKDTAGSLTTLEKEWEKLAGGYPLSYQFLDDSLAWAYRREDKTITLISAFSALAIFISCLGLTGLVTFLAEQRKKEIGIRKVLGASVSGIVSLFSWRFIRLVLIAAAIALPLSILAVEKWLENFAYAIKPDWYLFALPVVVILTLAMLVSSGFTLKAAKTNPVNCLRHE